MGTAWVIERWAVWGKSDSLPRETRASIFLVSGSNDQDRLDRIVGDVVTRAVRLVEPQRVWLFGSHVTGAATSASDVDLAFEVPLSSGGRWAAFVVEAQEEVPALVDLDLVDMGTCDPGLAKEITNTGRVVYERAK